MKLEVLNVSKRFGTHSALDRISFTLEGNPLVAILGPSGSGKTTLLRVLAGLETPDEGEVRFDGENIRRLQTRQRGIGFVFQHYALFRHMTVFENVAFGLEVKPSPLRPSRAEIHQRVWSLLRLVHLDWLADRRPDELSGGQRQRAALARALAVQPRILMLDEPFGALDASVRKELRRELHRLHDAAGITSLFVTHDVEEAFEIADVVLLLRDGRIEQMAPPQTLWTRPVSPFVFRFLGEWSLIPAISRNGIWTAGDPSPAQRRAEGWTLAHIRPWSLLPANPEEAETLIAHLESIQTLGPTIRLRLILPNSRVRLKAQWPSDPDLRYPLVPGTPIRIRPSELWCFNPVPSIPVSEPELHEGEERQPAPSSRHSKDPENPPEPAPAGAHP